MSQETTQTRLDACVETVWRRTQTRYFTHGLSVFIAWLIALFLVAMAVDWLISLPAIVRVVMVLGVVGYPLYQAWLAGWQYLRAYNAARTALQIEEHVGGMESLLVSAIQFRQFAHEQGQADPMTQLTCQRAEQAVEELAAEQVVPWQPLQRPAMIAGVALLVFLSAIIADSSTVKIGVARIFAPWLAVEYPTRTQLQLVSGDMVVQEGKPVRIAAELSGEIPANAQIALRTGNGRPRVQPMAITDNTCTYEISTVFREFDYRVTAGDAQSDWHTVRVIYPPNIEKAKITLNYPAYTQRKPETVEGLSITVPETTKVQWQLTLDKPVSAAAVNLIGQDASPMTISEDGKTVSFEQTAIDSRAYSFGWVEREHGYEFASPSYYLQVAPDRAPRIELTSPSRDLYATLGRKVDLAFRCRDDHGIDEAVVVYSVDKIEDQQVAFTPSEAADGSEQTVPWDYRTAIPELEEGQTVSFAIEVADRYPGESGPHRVRSDVRRIQFVPQEVYLAYIEKQKSRLLSRLKTIYREQRKVYEVVLRLDPKSSVFVQSCQLEAVRQDLVRERLNKLATSMHELTLDLQANGMADADVTQSLSLLRDEVRLIASDYVTASAQSLRKLASDTNGTDDQTLYGMSEAAYRVDSAARELGMLVLQLGYEDAAEVMAREMHAAAQNQATLRLHTITEPGIAEQTAKSQQRLAKWMQRLFDASPSGKETTVDEALVEFTLTRMVKRLMKDGITSKMQRAATLIEQGSKTQQAARLQEQVIAALLRAEFRLLIGAERDALFKAMMLLQQQAERQAQLRSELEEMDADAFTDRRKELVQRQGELQENLQLLLMPEIPARRPGLFEKVMPTPPAVGGLLATADRAMVEAASQLDVSERELAIQTQRTAEQAFASLVDVIQQRLLQMTEAVRIERLAYGAREIDERLELLSERQLGLLEKTEDAEADETRTDFLANQQATLADAVDEIRAQLARTDQASGHGDDPQLLTRRVGQAVAMMRKAVPLLETNKPGDAIPLQEDAMYAVDECRELLSERNAQMAMYGTMLAMAKMSAGPSPFVGEIEEEQIDLLKVTENSKPEDLPKLAIPQKNLVHAVDAILTALDPISHLVETGTVMLFAKEDMDAAGVALTEQDEVEALDAQEFIVETLQELRGKIDRVTPQYPYLLEIVDALYQTGEQGMQLRDAQRQLRSKLKAAPTDLIVLAQEQRSLAERTRGYVQTLNDITGRDDMRSLVQYMTTAQQALADADGDAASKEMLLAQQALKDSTAMISNIMERLTLILAAGEPGAEVPAEVQLLREVLATAAKQKVVYRLSNAAQPQIPADLEAQLTSIDEQLQPLIKMSETHKLPLDDDEVDAAVDDEPGNLHRNLQQACEALREAADAVKTADAQLVHAKQEQAAQALRSFIVEYAMLFVNPPAPPPPADPAPSDAFTESEDTMALFMPGAVMGQRPADGRLEWEVLGKRDRAALNENFARELPLEYREILKNYYERLAK